MNILKLQLPPFSPAVDLKDPVNRCSNLSDDEPVYDAVASDDDYAALAPVAQQVKLVRQQRSRSKNYSIG